jgi:hypothetical protein
VPSFLRADVLPLSELFDGRYRFRLNCQQRAYAWQPVNVSRLLSDLKRASDRAPPKRRYVLGRLMLAQQSGTTAVELIDGHQRLLTLTMLFAVLRDLETDATIADELHQLIADRGGVMRLSVQALSAPFFERAVQQRGGTELELDAARETLSESECNILDNRDCIRSDLLASGITGDDRRRLAKFLLRDCYVINVVTGDEQDAWEIIETEQETRLPFSKTDEAKAILLAAVRSEQRAEAARHWEACEKLLTSADMYQLLSHIRGLAWRGRVHSGQPVERDLIQRFDIAHDAGPFLSGQLTPHARLLANLRSGEAIASSPDAEAIQCHINWMTWVDPHSWVAGAMQWLQVRGANAEDTLEFFRKLDRLVWVCRISGVDPSVQETRLLALMTEIEKGGPVSNFTRLQIDTKLHADLVSNLRSINFANKSYAGLVLRRLSVLLGADSGPISREDVTIEHILPRNPPRNSEWRRLFRLPDDARTYSQQLGNVTLLSPRENQDAGTRAWGEKRAILAASPFMLSRQAAEEEQWTARTILRRTDMLTARLLADWSVLKSER